MNKHLGTNKGNNYPQSAASSFIAGDIIHSTSLDDDQTSDTSDSSDSTTNRSYNTTNIRQTTTHSPPGAVSGVTPLPTMDIDIDIDMDHEDESDSHQSIQPSDSENDPIF